MIEHWKIRAHGRALQCRVSSYARVYYILNSRCRDTNFSDVPTTFARPTFVTVRNNNIITYAHIN